MSAKPISLQQARLTRLQKNLPATLKVLEEYTTYYTGVGRHRHATGNVNSLTGEVFNPDEATAIQMLDRIVSALNSDRWGVK